MSMSNVHKFMTLLPTVEGSLMPLCQPPAAEGHTRTRQDSRRNRHPGATSGTCLSSLLSFKQVALRAPPGATCRGSPYPGCNTGPWGCFWPTSRQRTLNASNFIFHIYYCVGLNCHRPLFPCHSIRIGFLAGGKALGTIAYIIRREGLDRDTFAIMSMIKI